MMNVRQNIARNRALATAAMVGAGLAGNAARGAYQAAAERVKNAAYRYFKGDVNQPPTAKTAMQLVPMRPTRRRAARGAGMSIVEKGSLKLAEVSTPATTVTGTAIGSFPLTVDVIGGRLFAMSKLYSRWKFTQATLRYVPAVSSSTDGSIVVFYVQEPDDVYAVGESVGAGNAASALDNMELSVREKMSMTLHLPKQDLYTTPSYAEQSWHSAGVVNVINNGSLVGSKTYGSLYLDFVVTFSQPCAPFDVFSPLHGSFQPNGSGSAGTLNGPIFAWSQDAPLVSKDSGQHWLIDPATGRVNLNGRIYIPPMSSIVVDLVASDGNAANGAISWEFDPAIVSIAGENTGVVSTDKTVKTWHTYFSNIGSKIGWVTPIIAVAGASITNVRLSCSVVPYRAA